MDTRTIFFTGKPGSGKGTQVALLAKKTGWKTFSSGDILRSLATRDTQVGRKVKADIDIGHLVPHWFAEHIYTEALFSLSDNESVILDGFCREVPEAALIVKSLAWLERPFVVVNVQVSDDEVRRRLKLRKEVQGRADDSVVEERLLEYRAHTEPATELFRDAGVLVEVNGEQTPEAIAADIQAALGIA